MNELKKKKFIIHITLRYWLGSKEGLRRQQFGDLNVFLVVVAVVVGSSGSCSITFDSNKTLREVFFKDVSPSEAWSRSSIQKFDSKYRNATLRNSA